SIDEPLYAWSYTSENLENAVQAVCDGDSIWKASKKFSIPFSTLRESIKKNRLISEPSLGRYLNLSSDEEKIWLRI
ncbi:hypothetical protein ILUMI_19286, partial [Ignelater luminosus]